VISAAQPLVSVLIPCYNAARWIRETLESVLAQTWPNIEIIVVNDGSTDDTRSILAEYLCKGVAVIDQPNRGPSAALNRCLSAAHGEFIQYLDADDLIAPDKIELQMARLLEQPDCIATAEWARFRDKSESANFEPDETWQDMDPVDWLVADWREGGGMMYPAMWLLPRRLVETIGPWGEALTLTNDTEYFSRAVLAARKLLFCRGARTYYRSGFSGSLSGLKSRTGWESQYKVISLCQGYLLAREDSERTRRVCSMLWQRFAHASYPYASDLANRALEHAAALHPARLAPEGGSAFKFASHVLGWKAARMLQRLYGRV
jgi:glycosyltransferase involved in cell wall biosynthesis